MEAHYAAQEAARVGLQMLCTNVGARPLMVMVMMVFVISGDDGVYLCVVGCTL